MEIYFTPEDIQVFIDGRLDRSERERMLEHLDHCKMCVKWLADAGEDEAGKATLLHPKGTNRGRE